MEKYYTPDFDELHSGMECEIYHTSVRYKIPDNEWRKWVKTTLTLIDIQDLFPVYTLNLLNELNEVEKSERIIQTEFITEKWIRVKYLDKEDIMSLGWTFVKNVTNNFWCEDTFERTHKEGALEWKDELTLTLKPGKSFIYNNISLSLFNGHTFVDSITIKNKSELHKLMRQLLIV